MDHKWGKTTENQIINPSLSNNLFWARKLACRLCFFVIPLNPWRKNMSLCPRISKTQSPETWHMKYNMVIIKNKTYGLHPFLHLKSVTLHIQVVL